MRYRFYQILTIFQMIIASGTWVLMETSHSKMGVSRHLSYMNQKVDSAFQFENLSIILGIPLMVASVVFLVKMLNQRTAVALNKVVMFAYTFLTSIFILRNTTGTEVAYYYVILLMVAFIGIQIAKVLFVKTDTFEDNTKSNRIFNFLFLVLSLLIFFR